MSTPKKKAVVSRKVSDEQLQNSKRWEAFCEASSIPFEDLTDEWYAVFDAQANVLTAKEILPKLVDIAMSKDISIARDEKK